LVLTGKNDGAGINFHEVKARIDNSLKTFSSRGVEEQNNMTVILDEIPVAEIIEPVE